MDYRIEDLYKAAYLRLRGVEPELRVIGSQVIFIFDSELIDSLMDEYWEGAEVNVIKYIEKIKETRTMMYKKKDEKKLDI